ncbi:OprD family porin [Pseudomonas phytophila]|uniref:OprD family porin n=1 Tax=Pseudomonas phytophila TaxID=2867264 RepID=A0ABY6FFP2_9PSED|nr:OprD family porin [Pseudomonas phytophila]UXZ96733.1 OprD family porin [Pseudomonas phytophila]
MKKSTLAMAVAFGVMAQQAGAAGFLEDSKASVSSRTLYFDNDFRESGSADNNRETATGLKFDYLSGFTQGTVGFGLDLQALVGVHLDGGRGSHAANGGISPTDFDSEGRARSVNEWTRLGGNAKARFSKTELRLGNALAPNLPILVSNDGRLLPQAFQGGVVTSKEIDNVTLTAGQLSKAIGRASSNWTDLSVNGGTEGSNTFRFAGGDWKVTKDLTLQYYYANLEDYYKQHFLGLIHVLPLGEDQSFKTDLRYFNSSSDGKNGDTGYIFNNNNGYAKNPGEVDNQTWSAMFTYSLGGHAFLVGHQQVGDDGGMVFLNQGSVTKNGTNINEGNGGASVYLFTDAMVNSFTRAGENSTFGQYSYDFARVGVPGLKAAIAYIHAEDIKGVQGTVNEGREFSEWERDMRVDYVIQSGPLKGFGTTVRHGTYRADGDLNNSANTDQTRVIFNYTYAFK